MTPKEKAEQLADKYCDLNYRWDGVYFYSWAKECALIAVDEIIRTLNEDIRDLDVRGSVLLDLIEYWQEVEKEIKKL